MSSVLHIHGIFHSLDKNQNPPALHVGFLMHRALYCVVSCLAVAPQVGAVKCCPPFSANRLIFFQHKALLTNGSRISSWKSAREQSLGKLQFIPPSKEDGKRQFKPQKRPPLIRSVESNEGIEALARGDGLITTRPRSYQAEVFQSVVEGSRNSLVYLPSGLGETLVAAMVLKMLMGLNAERQAYFVVENGAEAMQQVRNLANRRPLVDDVFRFIDAKG